MNWYAYCGGDPINCVDLWGRQSAYLPGGGTSFNGSCPGMNYNIEEYTKKNETISNVTEGIFLRKNNELGVLIDKLTGSKKEKEAINIKNQLDKEFFLLTNNTKAKGEYDSDKDGKYNEEEIKKFVIYVNDTMLLNYSNSTDVGPYVVKTPQLTNKKADEFLNPKYQEDLTIYQSFNIPNNNNITNIQLSINSSKIDVPFLDIFDTKNKIKNK